MNRLLLSLSGSLILLLLLLPGPARAQAANAGTARTHYIAAEEVAWDYAPGGRDLMMGMPYDAEDSVFVANGPLQIGHVYKKARYVAYTDSTFTTRKAVPEAWAHKGLLGPILHAEVGDTLRVVFKNMAGRPYTVHPHGVFYRKDSEGSPTNDGTSGRDRADDAVPPGGTHTYVWPVPERAGPGPNDHSSVVWLYHSHTNEPRDVNTGLVGAIIVSREGMARPDGSPKDVDREIVALYKVFDENESWYIDENIQAYAGMPDEVDVEDEDFVESNLMHAINGWVYGSLPLLEMHEGERVRWYLLGLGSEPDLHTPHWHGNTLLSMGRRTDTVSLLPATVVVADMVPDNPGIWMFHCHVDDHIKAGMTGRYQVRPAVSATH